jgi:hypothetical protein
MGVGQMVGGTGVGDRFERLVLLVEASLEEVDVRLGPDAREEFFQAIHPNEHLLDEDAWHLLPSVEGRLRWDQAPISAYEVAVLHAGRLAERLREVARADDVQELSAELMVTTMAGICPLPPICR